MYLTKTKSGIYHYRRRYDSSTAKALNQKEFKRSLKTRELKTAQQRYTEAEVEYNKICFGRDSTPSLPQKVKTDTLSYVLAKKLEHKKSTYRTQLDWKTTVDRFISANGDLPLSKITRQRIRTYRDALAFYPRNRTAREKQTPFWRLIKISKASKTPRPCLTAPTIKKEISILKSIFNHAIKELDIPIENPASKISVDAKAKNRLPFSIDQLNKLFEEETYTSPDSPPHKYWLPLLALYTGARLEELGQCCPHDIKQHAEGFWYLDINQHHQHKKLKTKSSARKVPLHPIIEAVPRQHKLDKLM